MTEISPDYQGLAEQLRSIANSVGSVVIAGEASPDPDCAGSQLAMRRLLKQLNESLKITCLNDHGAPDNLSWLRDSRHLHRPKSGQKLPDLVVYVDGGIERCGPETKAFVKQAKRHVLIDHHLVGSQFEYELSIVNPKAASTTELIYELVDSWGLELDKATAEALYLGLVADTGSFQFPSTSPRTLRIAAALMEAGARCSFIAQKVRLERPRDYLEFQRRLLSRVQHRLDGKLLIVSAHKDDLRGLELGDAPYDQAILGLSFIKGVEVFAMLKGGEGFEKARGAPWRRLSFRSRGSINVAKLARKLDNNGGGHAAASGCLLHGTDEEIIERLESELKPLLAKL